MLRPMIKEWLDANLASIVEEKVEAEVERISRMAR
jgi:cell pole-organizing protein PopZ